MFTVRFIFKLLSTRLKNNFIPQLRNRHSFSSPKTRSFMTTKTLKLKSKSLVSHVQLFNGCVMENQSTLIPSNQLLKLLRIVSTPSVMPNCHLTSTSHTSDQKMPIITLALHQTLLATLKLSSDWPCSSRRQFSPPNSIDSLNCQRVKSWSSSAKLMEAHCQRSSGCWITRSYCQANSKL